MAPPAGGAGGGAALAAGGAASPQRVGRGEATGAGGRSSPPPGRPCAPALLQTGAVSPPRGGAASPGGVAVRVRDRTPPRAGPEGGNGGVVRRRSLNLGPLFEGAAGGNCPVCGAVVRPGGLAAHLKSECYGPGASEAETPRLGPALYGWESPADIQPPMTLMNRLALPRLRTPGLKPLSVGGAGTGSGGGGDAATPAASVECAAGSGEGPGEDVAQDWDSPIGEFISQKEDAGFDGLAGGELGDAERLGSPPREPDPGGVGEGPLMLSQGAGVSPDGRSLSDSEALGGDFNFSIRCSQHYERVPDADVSPDAYQVPASPEPEAPRELEMARTPELMHAPVGTAGGSGGSAAPFATPPLYSIFLPKSERKKVIVVRHGESQFNAADAHGTSWSDPCIFDAPLTARGHAQARALREQMLPFQDALWVTSPLSRAMQTCLDACPWRTPAGEPDLPVVLVRPEIAEHCATTGDVGRPPAALAHDFPLLEVQLRKLPDVWWWSPPGKPNDSERMQFSSAESRAQMATRVEAFRAWVLGRPEQTIVAFGHSTFWKYFLGKQHEKRLKNCEVFTAYF